MRNLTAEEKEELIGLWERNRPQTSPHLISFAEGRVAELRSAGDDLSILAELRSADR